MRDVGGMGKFETEEKDSDKPNERLHGVVEVKRNGGGRESGEGGRRNWDRKDEPMWRLLLADA